MAAVVPQFSGEMCPKCSSNMLERKAYGRTLQVSCWKCSLVLFLGPRETIAEAYERRESVSDNALAQINPTELEQWRAALEQRHYRQLIGAGSTHHNARRLSRQRADLELEAEIARVALQRYSFGAEARERRQFAGISPDVEWSFDDDQSKGTMGKSHSGGRKRRKPKPPYEPGSRLGEHVA